MEYCDKVLYAFVIFVMVFNQGCAGISDDPAKGGLLGGIHGITSGKYDARVNERQQHLNQLEQNNQSYRSMVEELESTRLRENDNVDVVIKDLDSIDYEISKLKTEIHRLEVTDRDLLNKKKALSGELSALQKEADSLQIKADSDAQVNEQQVKDLETRRKRLESELDLLIEYTEALAE